MEFSSSPGPKCESARPYTVNQVAVFGRDPESSKQVWSADEAAGDFDYRDFTET